MIRILRISACVPWWRRTAQRAPVLRNVQIVATFPTKCISLHFSVVKKQESLANAKLGARQPWYRPIGRNSLNRPSLRNAQQHRWKVLKFRENLNLQQFKVDDFGTNRKRILLLLLLLLLLTKRLTWHMPLPINFGPISHRFWDTATYWLKIAHFSYRSVIRRPRPYVPFCISKWS